MKKRQILALLTALAFVFCLASCGGTAGGSSSGTQAEATVYTSTTITGEVTAIDGSSVTLQLGELTEAENPADGGTDPGAMADASGTVPEKPDGEDGTDPGAMANASGTVPEKPDGAGDSASSDGGSDAGAAADGGSVPDKPDGEGGTAPTGDGTDPGANANSDGTDPGAMANASGTVPEKPDGEAGGASMGEAPGGAMSGSMKTFTAGEETATVDLSGAAVTENGADAALSDIAVGDVLSVTLDETGAATSVTIETLGGMGGEMGGQGGFGGSGEVTQGDAATTIDADGTNTDTTYSSTGDDENALRVDGATVTLDGVTVDKSAGASSNTEDGDFYGMNAALLATNGANVTITGATVTSSAQNGNGVFSYGEGTVVNISDSTITTTADNSGGIQTTGGGTTNASNLTVTTSGSSAAAIRSDRGGGTVNVDGGTYTSNGYNSPAVYSTATITVKNATLTATNSEALVIEGQNSITLENCIVSGNMSDTKGTSSDENVHNVMIYQSMSGDAEVGTSSFSMTGGSLTSENGDLFYITNTNCVLTLSGVDIVNKETDGYLLLVSGNSASHGWGTAGANGANVTFTADGQTLEGNIAVDTISTLNMTLSGNSTFTGTVNIIENAEGGAAVDNNAVITVEAGSTWNLTGDCTITSLENNGTINFNGYTITLADGTVLNG